MPRAQGLVKKITLIVFPSVAAVTMVLPSKSPGWVGHPEGERNESYRGRKNPWVAMVSVQFHVVIASSQTAVI